MSLKQKAIIALQILAGIAVAIIFLILGLSFWLFLFFNLYGILCDAFPILNHKYPIMIYKCIFAVIIWFSGKLLIKLTKSKYFAYAFVVTGLILFCVYLRFMLFALNG